MYPWALNTPGEAVVRSSSSQLDLEPCLSQSIAGDRAKQLRKMFMQKLCKHLVSSWLTSASSLLWQKKKMLLREVNHYYQEQLLFYHIDSVLILITDTIFVKLKTGKYALIIKEMIRERTDF